MLSHISAKGISQNRNKGNPSSSDEHTLTVWYLILRAEDQLSQIERQTYKKRMNKYCPSPLLQAYTACLVIDDDYQLINAS